MFKSWMIIAVIAAITVNSGFAFVVDRPAATTWDTVPSLDTEQRSSVSNGKMQVTGMDKVLQASDGKKSAKHDEEPTVKDASRDKRSDVIASESAVRGSKSLEKAKDTSLPSNVVLLLIDEPNGGKVGLREAFRTKLNFPVQGMLKSCRNDENVPFKFHRQDDAMASPQDKDCECEHFLRANIGALLAWARQAKVMTTGAISTTNFSIPAGVGYEGSAGIAKEFDEADESTAKHEVRHPKSEIHDAWHLIDLDRQPGSSWGSPATKPEGMANSEGMWEVFDKFSRIRMAFFKTLLDSLGGPPGAREDEILPRRSSPLQSNPADLFGDTLQELKSASNEKGYMLVAAAPWNDFSSAVELLNGEISPKDTLLVVAGICSTDKKPVPFYARGPGAESLREASSVWDLPGAIKSAVTEGCRCAGCKVHRHDQTLPSLQRAALMPKAEDDDDSELRRIARQDETTVAPSGATLGISVDCVTLMMSLATSVVATLAVKF